MAFQGLLVIEIFHSLQGETSRVGMRNAFIRLTGCNLRCTYCDSTYSFKGGQKMSVDEIIDTIRPYQVREVLLTGGEPLLQRGTLPLLERLKQAGYHTSIETHGEVSIATATTLARIVMDVKTPGSGMCRGGYRKNIPFLKANDEVKFVITNDDDYKWACAQLPQFEAYFKDLEFRPTILFSPAVHAKISPKPSTSYSPKILAEAILRDRLDVRMQLQMHKIVWDPDLRGI